MASTPHTHTHTRTLQPTNTLEIRSKNQKKAHSSADQPQFLPFTAERRKETTQKLCDLVTRIRRPDLSFCTHTYVVVAVVTALVVLLVSVSLRLHHRSHYCFIFRFWRAPPTDVVVELGFPFTTPFFPFSPSGCCLMGKFVTVRALAIAPPEWFV